MFRSVICGACSVADLNEGKLAGAHQALVKRGVEKLTQNFRHSLNEAGRFNSGSFAEIR